jgi:uncharacterized ferritin-like protein (DUF455 family)
MQVMESLFDAVYAAITTVDVDEKLRRTSLIFEQSRRGELVLTGNTGPVPIESPGRPQRPLLVAPRELPRRSIHAQHGRAALLHALAHIEFNAINLALDAVYRFRELPPLYYDDWLRVAAEEVYHFELLQAHMLSLGCRYGDFVAHNALWETALRTSGDVLLRMALVPRVMEAHGLDVTPGLIARFESIGDTRAVEILKIIARDEVGHVEAGTRWFHYLCDIRGLSRQETFENILKQYLMGKIKLPLNREARNACGFTEEELQFLEGLS